MLKEQNCLTPIEPETMNCLARIITDLMLKCAKQALKPCPDLSKNSFIKKVREDSWESRTSEIQHLTIEQMPDKEMDLFKPENP